MVEKFANNGIIINAQEYKKWRTHLTNPVSGIGRGVSEWIFSDYKEMMEQLRAVDDAVRGIALGKSSATDISVRDAVAEAKRALNENRLIDALYYSAVINVIAQEVLASSADTVKNLRIVLYKQYGKKYDPKAMDYMDVLRGHKASQQKAAEIIADEHVEIKRYGQFLQGLYRTMFGDPLLKSWQNEIKKFRTPVENAVNKAEQFATNMIAIFDRMGVARTKGMIGDWIAGLDEIAKLQPQYGNDVLKAFTAIQPIIEAAKQGEIEESKTLGRDVSGQELTAFMLDMFRKYKEPKKEERDPVIPDIRREPTPSVGKPVSSPSTQQESKQPFDKSVPMKGPGRPPKKVTETFGVDPDQLYTYLINAGKSEKEIKETFDSIGLDYEATIARADNEPIELIRKINKMDQLQQLNVVDVLENASDNNGETETVQDTEGNIIGTIEDGIVSVEGLDFPVEIAPIILEQLRSYELPAHKEKPVPGTTIIGPGPEPILLPGKVEEPKKPEEKKEEPKKVEELKKEEPKIEEPKKEETKKVDEPKKEEPKKVEKNQDADRIIIFTDIKRSDERKAIETLSKAIGRPVNVMSVSDRKVKQNYPNAEFYALNIEPEEGESVFPKEAYGLLMSKMTKDTKARLKAIFGVEKSKKEAPKETEPVKEETPVKEKKEAPKKEIPKKEEIKSEETWGDAKTLEKGKAQFEDLIATVNTEYIDNFTGKSQTGISAAEADIIVIWLRGKITGAELNTSTEALKSYFEKEVIITPDGTIANMRLEKADKKGEKSAAYVWSVEDLRSVITFSKANPVAASVENAVLKLSHNRFYNQVKLASEFNDPYLIAQMMLDYSEAIEDSDEELSCKLLAKAQEIIDE